MTPTLVPRPVDILLVEDNPGDVLLTREALARTDLAYTLHVVAHGEAAMDFLRCRGVHGAAPVPDLVLLDLNLPRMSGREVLAEVKGDPVLKSLPVVVLTTSNAEEDVRLAYFLQANCYVTKPVTFDLLADVSQTLARFWFSTVTLPPKP